MSLEPATHASPFAAVPAALRGAMERRGFTSLTAVQRAVLGEGTDGRCLRISSQTGSGKTLALGLVVSPLFLESTRATVRTPRVLIITPTRELAVQVRDELRWLFADVKDLHVGAVTGGTDIGGERRMLGRGCGILVGTPGRLLDHTRSGALRCDNLEHVVLDEADRMLDMGFRDDLQAILALVPDDRRTHLVSATFPPPVTHLADAIQLDALHVEGTALGVANANIEHLAYAVDPARRYAALVNALLLQQGERVLVFVERRSDATALAEMLTTDGFAAQSFSGELSQAQRTRALESFRRGTTTVLVATDVAARGIDIADVSLVVHGSLPSDSEAYVHRAGRTGRAGASGTSLALVLPRAQRYFERIVRQAGIELQWTPVPTPSKVRKTLRKRIRRALERSLDATTPDPQHLVDAARLLEHRDPTLVVAALLARVATELPREPMAVPADAPHSEPRGRPARRHSRPSRPPPRG